MIMKSNIFKYIHYYLFSVFLTTTAVAAEPPYPQSALISGIVWEYDATQYAPGSDLWVNTWASDGNIYTAWGDGGGFDGSNSDGRVSAGFARISGAPESFTAVNVNGGVKSLNTPSFGCSACGKVIGMISVEGTIYMWLYTQAGSWPSDIKLGWSTDLGATWQIADWRFPEDDFVPIGFVNFGKDYAGARDSYVYFNGGNNSNSRYMGRASKSQLKNRSAYEFFAGLDADGKPVWTTDITQRKPYFTDPNGAQGDKIVYNAALGRYILTIGHNAPGASYIDMANLGVFEAPEPWGPWSTIAYYTDWGVGYEKTAELGWHFNNKWTSADGLTMWMTYAAWPVKDSFNLAKATFVRKIADSTAPSIPADLSVSVNGTSIDLGWTAASDAESGITGYRVYRDNALLTTVTTNSFRDEGLLEATSYTYQVSALNGSGLEGDKSAAMSATTVSDNTPPALKSVVSLGDPTTVEITFTEKVGKSGAESVSSYSITPGITIQTATLQPDQQTVILTTSTLSENVDYLLAVNNVYDLAASPIVIAENSKMSFNYESALGVVNVSILGYEWDTSLATGKAVYIDRGFSYTDVPSKYQDMTYLRTANDDKYESASQFLNFDVTQAVSIYVGFDIRSTVLPVWLQGWTNTGDVIATDDTSFRMYKKEYPEGRVTLGGNEMGNSMYIVVLDSSPTSSPVPVDPGSDVPTEPATGTGDSASSRASGGAGSTGMLSIWLVLLFWMSGQRVQKISSYRQR